MQRCLVRLGDLGLANLFSASAAILRSAGLFSSIRAHAPSTVSQCTNARELRHPGTGIRAHPRLTRMATWRRYAPGSRTSAQYADPLQVSSERDSSRSSGNRSVERTSMMRVVISASSRLRPMREIQASSRYMTEPSRPGDAQRAGNDVRSRKLSRPLLVRPDWMFSLAKMYSSLSLSQAESAGHAPCGSFLVRRRSATTGSRPGLFASPIKNARCCAHWPRRTGNSAVGRRSRPTFPPGAMPPGVSSTRCELTIARRAVFSARLDIARQPVNVFRYP